jgi:hypothetical protein
MHLHGRGAAATLVVAGLLLAGATARAGEVYVNGVRIYQLSNVRLEGCTVTFDAQGNVRVDAPGYEIRVQGQPGAPQPPATPARAPAPPPGGPTVPAPPPGGPTVPAPAVVAPPPGLPLDGGRSGVTAPAAAPASQVSNRYLATTWARGAGPLPFQFDLQVNGTPIKRFRASDVGLAIDLTPFLRPGENTVRILTEYQPGTAAPTWGAGDAFGLKVQVGRGAGTGFVAGQTLFEFSRTGAQLVSTIKEYQLELR